MSKDYVKNTVTSDYVLFLTTEFSQWFPSNFTSDEGLPFTFAEQYMMYNKAKLMGDTDTAVKVMLAKTPKDQKDLGRQVKNFNKALWDSKARDVVYQGNYYKFTQNPHLYDVLMDTKGRTLVEAAHYDPVWGIGLRADDPLAADPKNWQGTNWLGGTLNKLRDALDAEGFKPQRNPDSLMLRFNDAAGQRILYIEAKDFLAQKGFSLMQDFGKAQRFKRGAAESAAYQAGLRPQDVACPELDIVVKIKGCKEPLSNTEEMFDALNPGILHGRSGQDHSSLVPVYGRRLTAPVISSP